MSEGAVGGGIPIISGGFAIAGAFTNPEGIGTTFQEEQIRFLSGNAGTIEDFEAALTDPFLKCLETAKGPFVGLCQNLLIQAESVVAITKDLSGQRDARFGTAVGATAEDALALLRSFGGRAHSFVTELFPDPNLLDKLFELLVNPPRAPGEPCLAPAPLLRDLLDLALGKIGGGIEAIFGKVKGTVLDLLFPAAVEGHDLERFVQAVLDDPVTAALNLVLGQRNQIDCESTASLGVGTGVIETLLRRVTGAVAEALA